MHDIKAACISIIGKVRENNEDNFYFDSKILLEQNNGSNGIYKLQFSNIENKAFAIFDGMGGESKGERASYLATIALKEHIKQNGKVIWKKYIEEANNNICNEMKRNQRMGTTMAGIYFSTDKIEICNVGDSRIYGMKNNVLQQISEDHTDAKLQERLNIKSNQKARLVQHLGIWNDELTIIPFEQIYDYDKFDKMLICSDGLTDMLSDKEIQNILLENNKVEKIVEHLAEETMNKGGIDNTTIILIEIKPENKKFKNKLSNILDFVFNK